MQVNNHMPTKWFYPTTVSQRGEVPQHISWLGVDNFTSIKNVRTVIDLTTIANDLQLSNLRTMSYYLFFTGFGITANDIPDTLNGIEVSINVKRGGRVLDENVSLWHGTDSLTSNKADADLSNIKTYGSSTDTWNAVPMIRSLMPNPDFGLMLRYQSNVSWPHRTTPNMEHIQLRLW